MIFANIDFPNFDEITVLDGWVHIAGWAAATDPITEITLSVNGGNPVPAFLGDRRPDVEHSYPACIMPQHSGFKAYIRIHEENAASFQLGLHVEDATGGRLDLSRELRIKSGDMHFLASSSHECPNCRGSATFVASNIKHGPYALHQCPRCGFGAVRPLPATEYLAYYYNEIYWQHAGQRPSGNEIHPDFENIQALVNKYNPGARRIYECGCGPALLLAGFKNAGYEVFGQDYSVEAARIASDLFGISVNVAPLNILPDWPCDVVLLRHVIEHSLDPCSDLERVFSLLRENGIVVVITPNMCSLQARLMRGDWEWFIPPAHLGFFSPKSFSAFAKARNIALRHIETREGDGTPQLSALRHFKIRRESRMESWERDRLSMVIALMEKCDTPRALNALGLENEVISIFQKKKP